MIGAVALLGALLLGGPVEPAAAIREVSLSIDACPALPRDQVVRLLALELEAPVVAPEQAGARAVRVQVACAGATVRIAVDDPARGSELRRATVFPAEHEDVVVRLVALAVSELVLTSRVALSFDKAPAAARVEGALSSPPPLAPAPARPAGQGTAYVLAVGQAVGPFTGVGTGWGGGLRLGWAFARRWAEGARGGVGPAADLELGAARAAAASSLGTVQVSLWSATLRASVRLRLGGAWLDAGGGGRLGLAHIEGQPQDATSARGGAVAGTWAGPVAYAGVGGRYRHVVVAVGVEAGRVLRSVTGLVDGGTPVAISGSWACGTVAAGWGE